MISVSLNSNSILSKTYTSSSDIGTIFGGQVKEYIIGDGVTKIGDYAFYKCYGLSSIKISNSVTSIGDYAFNACKRFKQPVFNANCFACMPEYYSGEYIIPDGIKQIAGGAFEDCQFVSSITIPNSVTNIGKHAFLNCDKLEKVVWNAKNCIIKDGIPFHIFRVVSMNSKIREFIFGEEVESIPSNLCYQLSNLTTITIPNSVKGIGEKVFAFCSGLTSITIGKNVTNIGESAFYGCTGLTAVNIDDLAAWIEISFKNIYSNPLYYTHNLYLNGKRITDLVIPDSVTRIGDYAFYEIVDLTSVTISKNVTYIGNCAFFGCSGLTSVTNGSNVAIIGNSTFEGCNKLTSITLPNSVTSIGTRAFYDCDKLTSAITIPNGVTSIGNHTFYNCRSLKSITIGNSVENIGDSAFYSCSGLTSITIPNSVVSIKESAFAGCDNLTSVTLNTVTLNSNALVSSSFKLWLLFGSQVKEYIIGNDVTAIGHGTFYECSNIISVAIGNNVKSIGDEAFAGCSNLTTLTMGNKVTSIGTYAFNNCSSLTSMTIGDNVSNIGAYAFAGCSKLSSVILNSNTIVSTYSDIVNLFGNQVKNYIIGNNVTSIGYGTFRGCTNLTSITIPGSVTSIGNDAFEGCSSLTSITIPNSVTSIGNYAFASCRSLTSLTLPNSVTSIGDNAFNYCSGLTSINIPNSVTSIGKYTFSGCKSLTSITIQDNITSIGVGAFSECTGLKSAIIGNNVTTIRNSTFSKCSGLKSVTIGNSVKTINASAFSGCSNLESIINYHKTPPMTDATAFSGVDKFACKVYVLEGSVDMYKVADVWRDFYYILAIDTAEKTTAGDKVTIEPGSNSVTITWPTQNDAATYTIQITKDGVVCCTLIFNTDGQLIGLAFAPSRNGSHPSPAAIMVNDGMKFTVTGLDESTEYAFSVITKNNQDEVIASYTGKFTTGESTGLDDVETNEDIPEVRKVFENGNIIIVTPDGRRYNLQGAEVR